MGRRGPSPPTPPAPARRSTAGGNSASRSGDRELRDPGGPGAGPRRRPPRLARRGRGGRTLVASNGIGVSTFFWRRLSEHFARRGDTFVTWDYRGHGRSPVPEHPESLTVASCARDLWTV